MIGSLEICSSADTSDMEPWKTWMTGLPYEHIHFIKEDWEGRGDIIWAPFKIQNQSQVQQEAEEGGSY